jgi:hypothetical protein
MKTVDQLKNSLDRSGPCIGLQAVQFKMQLNKNRVLRYESNLPWFLGRCSQEVRKICAMANMVYSRAEHVFILEHYFAWKSSLLFVNH